MATINFVCAKCGAKFSHPEGANVCKCNKADGSAWYSARCTNCHKLVFTKR